MKHIKGSTSVLSLLVVLQLTGLVASGANLGTPSPAIEQEEIPPQNVIYSLIQGFPEAQAERRKKGKVIRGWWAGSGFQFEDSPPNTTVVYLSEDTLVNGRSREAISFWISAGYETSLIFSKVPPGRRLRIFYALADSTLQSQQQTFVQMEVSIGKKKIFAGQTNTKGWKEKTIDLTIPFLLQGHYDLTIKVRTADPEPKIFVFYGYIE